MRISGSTGRRGYALLAVLWICAGIALLGVTVSTAARDAIASSRNRIALAEAEWLAHGCLARVRSRLGSATKPGFNQFADIAPEVWLRLDSLLAAAPRGSLGACRIEARPVGARLNVNSASDELVSRVLRHAGLPAERADSIAAALADWKDADDDPRALGAERDWYEKNNRMTPSNRPISDRREIGFVRGVSAFAWDELFDVEPGAISLSHAPAPILAALPGFTPATVARVIDLRRTGSLHHFRDVASGLPPGPASVFMDALPELVSLVSLQATAWTVRAEASAGVPAVHVTVEVQLERSGAHARSSRLRTWSR